MAVNAITKTNILEQACKECGLDRHIKVLELKCHATTLPEKRANEHRKMHTKMPIKSTFMYCDGLDMIFFFDKQNRACVSFYGWARNDSRDLKEKKLQEAILDVN